jgi:hypothetical protein
MTRPHRLTFRNDCLYSTRSPRSIVLLFLFSFTFIAFRFNKILHRYESSSIVVFISSTSISRLQNVFNITRIPRQKVQERVAARIQEGDWRNAVITPCL